MSQLSTTEREQLLALARKAIEARVSGGAPPTPGRISGRLDAPGAAFVSVHVGHALRGCLGCIEPRPQTSLAETVVHLAAAAAREDPRFLPLSAADLAHLAIEISVLGPLLPISRKEEIVIGRDGLVVEQSGSRGLLLPQVAAEHGWDPEHFLEETCRKAGLARFAWREGARAYRFEAEVFSDQPGAPSNP